MHKGIDIAAPNNAPIQAAGSGIVVRARYEKDAESTSIKTMGNWVQINHGNGQYTIYMHCSSLLVTEGQQVSAGQVIARVGTTGSSTGYHLHFGVRLNGNYVNPHTYLGM